MTVGNIAVTAIPYSTRPRVSDFNPLHRRRAINRNQRHHPFLVSARPSSIHHASTFSPAPAFGGGVSAPPDHHHHRRESSFARLRRRPMCSGVPRRAAPARSGAAAGSRALVTKPPRAAAPSARGVTMPRDPSASRVGATKRKIVNGVQVEVEAIVPVGLDKPLDSACLDKPLDSACLAAIDVVSSVSTQNRTKRTRSSADTGSKVLTAPGDPARDRLHKRMASELEALRELMKKAELIARGPARKGGAAPAIGKSKRVLPGNVPPQPEPRTEAGGKTPSVKRRKVSPLPEKEQKQRMTADEREQLAGRVASLAEVPSQIAEFLQKRLCGGGADEIEIDFDSAEDSVLFELQALLDKLVAEEPPSPRASEVAQSAEPKKKVQDAPRAAPKEVSISGAIYKAKTHRQLLEMERAVVPDESIQERDLRRLRIAEYGRPGIMRQLGLYLKADA
ncbi:unnamed protein product [Urochloa humidicola]